MSRGSRTLTALYAATALWLAWWTVQSFGVVPPWFTATLAAASITPVIAAIRETVIADERRHVAVLQERHARPTAHDHGPPLTASERAVFNRLAAAIDLPGPDEPRSAA